MPTHRIGIIGGSGLYNLKGLSRPRWTTIKTPFGPPSDQLLCGTLEGRQIVFLPRHARGHRILPSELNHRANIWALKKMGVEWIISVSAVGSLQPQYRPRDVVVIDQFVDRTKKSAEHSFFGRGIVAHIAFADPVCPDLRRVLIAAARRQKARVHPHGAYVCMEGPAFSTRAESIANHQAGFDVIGMTNLGEARCAREAEIAYATLAMITDYDAWKTDEEPVNVETIVENLRKNADLARAILLEAIRRIPENPDSSSHHALRNALLTPRDLWPPKTARDLAPILQKYSS